MSMRPSLIIVMVQMLAVAGGVALSGVAGAQTLEVLHSFSAITDGAKPNAPLIQAANGAFYGTTTTGGSAGLGTVFKISPDGTFTVLHHFTGNFTGDGAQPFAPLLEAADGNLYGTTMNGGFFGHGTVFRMTPGGDLTVLHQFTGVPPEGVHPKAGLIQLHDGRFYGTTTEGGDMVPGSWGYGTVFTMTADGTTLSTLYSSFGQAAAHPTALVEANDGHLYGTAPDNINPPFCCGAAFRITTDGAVTLLPLHLYGVGSPYLLHTVSAPKYSLIQASDGYLYGVGVGTGSYHLSQWWPGIFRLSTAGDVTLMPTTPAANAVSSLVEGPDGAFYAPGGSGLGHLFRATRSGALTVLHTFAGAPNDGSTPRAGLTFGRDGHLYGTTEAGGTSNDGVIFRLNNPLWTVESAAQSLSADFDGDGATDLAVYRPTTGEWFVRNSSQGYVVGAGASYFQWGAPGDVPMPRDFDGDGRADIAVYRRSTGQWFIRYSSRNYDPDLYGYFEWGATGDVPISVDLDGDRRSDVGVFRPSSGYWYFRLSSADYVVGVGNWIFKWGDPGDIPVTGDFDGDARVDIAVYRPTTGQWFVRYSTRNYDPSQYGYHQWGATGDVPLVADFDGDGKVDVSVFRPTSGQWFILYSSKAYDVTLFGYFGWGAWGDLPRLGDFDADHSADVSVYRPTTGQWFIRYSSHGYDPGQYGYFEWGATGDIALPPD